MEDAYLAARKEYIELIRSELLGPGSEVSYPDKQHELISTPPHNRYSIGILFPRDQQLQADNDDTMSEQQEETSEEEESALQKDAENESENKQEDQKRYKKRADDDDNDNNLDEEISLAAQNMPSSVGFTFLAKGKSDIVNCNIQFATYRKAKPDECMIPFYPNDPEHYIVPSSFQSYVKFDVSTGMLKPCVSELDSKTIRLLRETDVLEGDEFGLIDALYKLSTQLRKGYVRIPHEVIVSLDFSSEQYLDCNKALDETTAKVTALRQPIDNETASVTIMLVNDCKARPDGENCLLQPCISVSTKENSFVLTDYASISDISKQDIEEQTLEMLYRNKKNYGTGLGASVYWEIDQGGNGFIQTDLFPQSEVPGIDFSSSGMGIDDGNAFSMRYYSDLDKTDRSAKTKSLRKIVDAYQNWIEDLKTKAEDIEEKYLNAAKINIENCERSLTRMINGLQILADNQDAWDAFQLANRAMFMQRIHLQLQPSTDTFPGDEKLAAVLNAIDYSQAEDKYFWRPFQIAFLVMSIASIVKEDSSDRELVDLIWFPTGGGKTEAYLGLTAFTIFYRRLAHLETSDGTTVIMRYTLRLLTAQQFTRAATMICACEYIREDSTKKKSKYGTYMLGRKPITIGLWIGGSHVPNKKADAKKMVTFLAKATASNLREEKEKNCKFQLLKCPWCGTKMVKEVVNGKLKGQFGYRTSGSHFQLFCPHESCYFYSRDSLPIQVIDEELYADPPTLLFGTVDKFAMFPWKPEVGSFFGINRPNRAPELIIQDELHLISGPLGTMVGLYESIIDMLCQKKGNHPKVVASTATIRRAKEQCASLYNRDVCQFPPPGLDAEDSFFAKESIIDHSNGKFGRMYIGLMPSGKTKAMMEIRSIAALLQTANTMDLPDNIRDSLWTLTVYFNSLRDLGKCSTLIEDDVKDFMKRMVYRLGTAQNVRMVAYADELTSRVPTTKLNETLDKLEKIEYSKENIEDKRYPSTVVLATNMISVGIDVARLNVMLLVGQPKLTSEYIQASSRIGRTHPGIAFAMYDGAKSRDRSHFEQFKPYHESFYKYVEPTGVTTFSAPARERALHALLIAMLRNMHPELWDDKSAAEFTTEKYESSITEVKLFLKDRCSNIIKQINTNMQDDSSDICAEIDTITEKWMNLLDKYGDDHFIFGHKFLGGDVQPASDEGRLMKPFNSGPYDPAFDTLTSMRNVDTAVSANVLIWEEEKKK
ncbi:MAG: helicase [Clostridia bacterium]|nr:helicase [Clostridia bacterium]